MTKPAITFRNVKNAALTYSELDTNFQNLRDATINFTDGVNTRSMDLNDTTTIEGAHNMVITCDEATGKITIDNRLSDYTQEPMGFENRTDSTISFNNSTRVFTIAPAVTSYRIWVQGEQYTKTTAATVTVTATTGLYYIYFDNTGTLSVSNTYYQFGQHAPVAYVYWNNTTGVGLMADERHGITLDWATHEYLHRTRGASYASGFDLQSYTTTGTGASNADAQVDLANGTFFDEDIKIAVTHSNTPTANTWEQDLQGPAQIPVIYHSGATGTWVIDAARDYAVKNGTSLVTYNLNTSGTWTTPDATSTHFVAYWIVATNFVNTPVISIMGQRSDNKLTDAQENNTWYGLDLTGFPNSEFRPLYRLIFRTSSAYANTPKALLADVQDIRAIGIIGAAVSVGTGGLTALVDDLTPQLGGNLDVNGYLIQNTQFPYYLTQQGNEFILQSYSHSSNAKITISPGSDDIATLATIDSGYERGLVIRTNQVTGVKSIISLDKNGKVIALSSTDGDAYVLIGDNTGNGVIRLFPMTTTQRNARTTVSNGMIIYNETTHKFQGYANGTWVDLH